MHGSLDLQLLHSVPCLVVISCRMFGLGGLTCIELCARCQEEFRAEFLPAIQRYTRGTAANVLCITLLEDLINED